MNIHIRKSTLSVGEPGDSCTCAQLPRQDVAGNPTSEDGFAGSRMSVPLAGTENGLAAKAAEVSCKDADKTVLVSTHKNGSGKQKFFDSTYQVAGFTAALNSYVLSLNTHYVITRRFRVTGYQPVNEAQRADIAEKLKAGILGFGAERVLHPFVRVHQVVLSFFTVWMTRQRWSKDQMRDFVTAGKEMFDHLVGQTSPNDDENMNEEQDIMKYHTNVWCCRIFRHKYDQVKKPKWATEPESLLMCNPWLKRMVGRYLARREIDLFYSLQLAKVVWPSLSENKFAKEEADTMDDLCTPDPEISGHEWSEITDQIYMDSLKYFGKPDLPTKMTPTMKSCVQVPYRYGGGAALFLSADEVIQKRKDEAELDAYIASKRTEGDDHTFSNAIIKNNDEESLLNIAHKNIFGGSISTPRPELFQTRSKIASDLKKIDLWRNATLQEAESMAFRRYNADSTQTRMQPLLERARLGQDPVMNGLAGEFRDVVGGTTTADGKKLQQRIRDRYDFLEGNRPDEYGAGWNDVKLTLLPEASKIRGITIGDGFLYTSFQPCQGQILGCWKKTRFTTMVDDLETRISALAENASLAYQESHSDSDPWFWVSGDYSAATNKLNKWVSVAAIRSLARINGHQTFGERADQAAEEHPDEQLYHNLFLAIRSFDDCRVFDKSGKWRKQEGGQLMGHPLSFGLLCLENLAVYHVVIRRALQRGFINRKQFSLLYDNVLVNGDDIAFCCPKSVVDIFYEVSSLFGFSISVGKNYISSDLLQINKRIFKFEVSDIGFKFVHEIGYFNQKFTSGFDLKANGAGQSMATATQMGGDVNTMCAKCPFAANAIPSICRRWSSAWRGWFQPNWFLPVHLGGFGIDPKWSNESTRVTKEQRCMANYFVHNQKAQLYQALGGGSVDPSYLAFFGTFEWKTFEQLTAYDAELLTRKSGFGDAVEASALLARSQMTQKELAEKASAEEDQTFDLRYFVQKFMKEHHKWTPLNLRTIEKYRTAHLVFIPRIQIPGSLPLVTPQLVSSRLAKKNSQ